MEQRSETKKASVSCLSLAVLFVSGLLVSACDEAEQGRILQYQPGVYLGQPDTELSEEEQEALRAELRSRTKLQGQ